MILVLGVRAFVRALLVNSAAVPLENVALQHQLAVLQQSVGRRRRDRLFWVGLSQLWAGWRASLFMFSPRSSFPGTAKASSSTHLPLALRVLDSSTHRRELVHVNVTDHQPPPGLPTSWSRASQKRR